MSDKKECVKVAVRCRPLNKDELERQDENIVNVKEQRGQIIVHNTKDAIEKDRVFSFDMVFAQNCLQSSVFDQAALPIIQSILQGYNGTIFAYGQTGTGKTHTMQGSKTQENLRGVIPRTFEHIFKSIEGIPDTNFMVQVSMLELYNQQIVDLLSSDPKSKLQLHQNKDKGVYVHGLSYYHVTQVQQMKRKLKEGSKHRHTGSTEMNKDSSRSHSIFMIRVQQQSVVEGQSKIRAGRLNLVDLAGSERQKKTQATGNRSKQGIHINLALSTLGQVIGALTNPSESHIPYRDSKLTRLLQQSLGGNARTIMIANVGPSSYNSDQTISTLRYAAQAKRIKNKPKINQDPKDAMIREYQEEIQRLKRQLEGKLPMQEGIIQKKVKVTRKIDINTKLQKQRQNIEKQKIQLQKEQQKQKKQLENKKLTANQQREAEKKKQEQLAIKLKQMKQKFLHGSKLKQQTRLHDKKIFQAQQELEERKQQERRLAEELEQKQLQVQDINEKNLPLKEKVEHQRKQLAKINHKLKIANQQAAENEEAMMQESEDIEQENRQIARELKFANLIIENFVPIDEVQAIQPRLHFDDSYDDWVIVNQEKMIPNPGSCLGFRAPLYAEGRAAVAYGDINPRFRQANIINMSLSLVDPTTEDFSEYKISPNILQNLSVIMNQNEQQQRQIAEQQRPNVYIDDPDKMDKQQILKQHENSHRLKSAKMMRPASGKRKKLII